VHIWLADQAQSSISAWLTSPIVALLALIATVISILQGLISTTKWFIRRTEKPDTRRRLVISVTVCIIASIVVLAPFTWETMAREDEKMGNPLWIAELFPAVIFAPLTICISSYLRIASDHHIEKRPWSLIVLTAMCLAVPAGASL
jgi:ABC-type spermidine/putrescine transport system permease subunit II